MHIRKSWEGNAIKKISAVVERTTVLQILGDIMYGRECKVDEDLVDWVVR